MLVLSGSPHSLGEGVRRDQACSRSQVNYEHIRIQPQQLPGARTMPLPHLVMKGTLMILQQNFRMNIWGLAMARNLSFSSFLSGRGWGGAGGVRLSLPVPCLERTIAQHNKTR